MTLRTPLCELLGIEHPIVQAPITNEPALPRAVATAGALGTIQCTSASVEPSYVLRACGVEDELAHASLRFGVGRFNTAEEIDFAVAEVTQNVERLRALHALGNGRLVEYRETHAVIVGAPPASEDPPVHRPAELSSAADGVHGRPAPRSSPEATAGRTSGRLCRMVSLRR